METFSVFYLLKYTGVRRRSSCENLYGIDLERAYTQIVMKSGAYHSRQLSSNQL